MLSVLSTLNSTHVSEHADAKYINAAFYTTSQIAMLSPTSPTATMKLARWKLALFSRAGERRRASSEAHRVAIDAQHAREAERGL